MNCVLSDAALHALLQEDCPGGDLTTETLGIGKRAARLTFCAREAMTVCGSEEAARLFALNGARVDVRAESGDTVAAGTVLLEANGSAQQLHQTYKVAQTLMEATSGIAGAARAITAALHAAGMTVPLACTRKNFPGTKALSIKAVKAGGATLHRLGLSETLLLFAEHRMFLETGPAATVQAIRARQPEKKIVVEARDEASALEWAQAGIDVLQLDKFTPAALRDCRMRLIAAMGDKRPLLAATGGIHAGNAVDYAAAGADLLVSSSPYLAAPADVQVRFYALPGHG
ncbi:ModD protein [Paludibacterium yongneupense]|uniref:ModD protein n=1 Tax=Paludibacterium yongneupense TaxID=400061 RepID=UPI0003F8CEB4|nr:ModD protein [Paludibacterium yongneupense]